MVKLNKPANDAKDVFRACTERVRNQDLKSRFARCEQMISDASTDYDDKGNNGQLSVITPHNTVGPVTGKEMEGVYDRMLDQGTSGRKIYDEIKAAPKHSRCPLCNHRVVSTIDHHLPISQFPIFAVVPFNLVPACIECNKIKLAKTEPTLHPYYDDVENLPWLEAQVVEGLPVTILFKVSAPVSWSQSLKDKVHSHFNLLEISGLYSKEAANELCNIQYNLKTLFSKGGTVAVANHLTDAFISREKVSKNSWQTALYRALASNIWFHLSVDKM